MSMNREMKRHLQRQGQLTDEGTPARAERRERRPRPPQEERTKPREFVRQVFAELRKVQWPTRNEVINYSIIVLMAVILLTLLIGALDWFFGTVILDLYER
jgi:preprotein translocase subunit SecE